MIGVSLPITARLARLGRAIRLRDWWHFLLLPFASASVGAQGALARGVAIAFGILAFGYLVNGLSDRALDTDGLKNPLETGGPATDSGFAAACFAALALALSLSAPAAVTIATATSLFAGTVYSIGPRLKRFPFVGTIANAACFAPMLWLSVPDDAPRPDLHVLGAIFAILLLQNQLLHEAADRLDDERGQVRTTFRAIGRRASALLGAALGATGAILAPHLALTIAMGAAFVILFPMALYLRGDDVRRMRTMRLAHRVACIAAGGSVFGALRLLGP